MHAMTKSPPPSTQNKHAALVAQACRSIEAAEQTPSLDDLAQQAGLSPFHFHRVFKAATGLTPKAYADAQRAQAVRATLARGTSSVTDAIFDAGFNANSRFYEHADAMLGMKPTQYRGGGVDARIEFAIGESSLGAILVARSQRGVCAISLGDDPDALLRELQDRFPRAELIGGEAGFETLVAQVVGLIEHPNLGIDLPLDVRGTAFQQRVWQALRQIPSGETASYAQIAQRIGSPKSVRAVAGACAANTLAVAIPCHRVVRSDGALSGYRWGVERKRELLSREHENR
jgi:AraC family transcriptional regulator, regulatory protein of adaptative response / methylated-DNA-[protein]-cysteine methyltransferase